MIDHGYGVTLDVIPDDIEVLKKLINWRNDPNIWKYCRQADLITWQHHMNWYDNHSFNNSNHMYLIKSDREPVGVCGLTSIDLINRRAEFSCYVGCEHQRSGYAKRALKTLFRHGFEALNLHLIYGETFLGNPALAFFKSLGMVEEGVRRDFYYKSGRYIDAAIISLKRDEFVF